MTGLPPEIVALCRRNARAYAVMRAAEGQPVVDVLAAIAISMAAEASEYRDALLRQMQRGCAPIFIQGEL